jgi:hypothetical protein
VIFPEDSDEEEEALIADLPWAFPHNPELLFPDDADDELELIAPNPRATMTPRDDEENAPESLLAAQEVETESRSITDNQWKEEVIAHEKETGAKQPQDLIRLWMTTDLELLKSKVLEPSLEAHGCRCCRHLDVWKETCGGEEFMMIGMLPHWKDKEEALRKLQQLKESKGMSKERQMDQDQREALEEQIKEELQQEIIVRIEYKEVGCLHPVFCVRKKTVKGEKTEWRKIVDCRPANAQMETIHFRMDSPETVQQVAQEGDFATSLDLKSAFNHLRVHESLRPFLCFAYKGQCFAYQAVPFGAKHSPRYCTQALGYAVRYIREHWPVRIVAYMDDILLLHQDPKVLELCTWQIARCLQCLGWTPSIHNCEFIPKQTIKFLN